MFNSPFLSLVSSFFPIFLSLNLLSLVVYFILWVNCNLELLTLFTVVMVVVLLAFIWWRDVVRESLLGYHTSKLEVSFRFGIVLFIMSEIFFFLSFFWAFYDSSLSPSVEIGLSWPPNGIIPLSVYSVPLLNTVILLSSGVSVTWSHHALINNKYYSSFISLLTTVILGVYFLIMQYDEYCESIFSMSDGVYGSTFFISTGFHGVHVIVGTTILLYTLWNLWNVNISNYHHFMFEASAWYWHFVDVVWLFLFISIYWWGSL